MARTKEECIRAIKVELYMNDDDYTEVKTDLLRDAYRYLSDTDNVKSMDPDVYYLKEISVTLKDILKEMRKRKV